MNGTLTNFPAPYIGSHWLLFFIFTIFLKLNSYADEARTIKIPQVTVGFLGPNSANNWPQIESQEWIIKPPSQTVSVIYFPNNVLGDSVSNNVVYMPENRNIYLQWVKFWARNGNKTPLQVQGVNNRNLLLFDDHGLKYTNYRKYTNYSAINTKEPTLLIADPSMRIMHEPGELSYAQLNENFRLEFSDPSIPVYMSLPCLIIIKQPSSDIEQQQEVPYRQIYLFRKDHQKKVACLSTTLSMIECNALIQWAENLPQTETPDSEHNAVTLMLADNQTPDYILLRDDTDKLYHHPAQLLSTQDLQPPWEVIATLQFSDTGTHIQWSQSSYAPFVATPYKESHQQSQQAVPAAWQDMGKALSPLSVANKCSMTCYLSSEVFKAEAREVEAQQVSAITGASSRTLSISDLKCRYEYGVSSPPIMLLMDFLYIAAEDSNYTAITWTDEHRNKFIFNDQHQAARDWGCIKLNKDMNYEKLSRAIREKYRPGLMKSDGQQRLTYLFTKTALQNIKDRIHIYSNSRQLNDNG